MVDGSVSIQICTNCEALCIKRLNVVRLQCSRIVHGFRGVSRHRRCLDVRRCAGGASRLDDNNRLGAKSESGICAVVDSCSGIGSGDHQVLLIRQNVAREFRSRHRSTSADPSRCCCDRRASFECDARKHSSEDSIPRCVGRYVDCADVRACFTVTVRFLCTIGVRKELNSIRRAGRSHDLTRDCCTAAGACCCLQDREIYERI